MHRASFSTFVLLIAASSALAAPPAPGYHAKTSVTASTRLDWSFVLTNQSLAKIPDDWLKDYDSKTTTYELFVPARKDSKASLPLLLYVSPGNEPNSFKTFEKLAKANNMLFVAPRGAGNDCPIRKRVRIVLDVLDDVRRHFPVDPDRTYITGFSGGGRVACAVAFALPELFGGVMPVCASGELRQESWLRHRAIDRLSVALITGEKDFNRGEVERWRGPMLADVGVRARVWMVNGMGHSNPGDRIQAEALKWLEDGLKKRRELAKTWPTSRYKDGDREAQAKLLFAEGQKKLADPKTLYVGLMQVKGVLDRWPDLDEAKTARKLLLEYEDRKEKPWEAEDIAEQRRFLFASAKGLDRYASGPLPTQYQKQKPDMIRRAIELYTVIVRDAPDSAAGKEAKKRLESLEKSKE